MKFEILTDFDGTLTMRNTSHGNSFSVTRDAMSIEGQKYSDEIYKIYADKEFDFNLSATERDNLMREWWVKEFEGIIKHKLDIESVKKAAANGTLVLRPYVKELFKLAKENDIPILILTAGVADIIIYKLAKEGLIEIDNDGNIQNKNIKVVGNKFRYGINGDVVEVLSPLVYTMNKYEIMKSIDKKIHADIAFVIGDHPADINMCDPVNHKEVISFGFLNNKTNNGDYDVYDTLYEKGDDTFQDILNKVIETVKK